MAVAEHIPLATGDTAAEEFFDAIQEILIAAAPSLRITIDNPATSISCLAANDDTRQGVVIEGRFRWVTGTISASLPGGLTNGVGSVYVTTAVNTYPPTQPNPRAFALQILASGTPSTAYYRKVGEVDVVSSTITAFRQWSGPRSERDPVWAQAPVGGGISALRAKGVASQSAPVVLVEDSAAARLFAVASDGKLLLGADVNLYRSAADTLKTDDSLIVTGTLTTGALTITNLTATGNTALGDAQTDTLAFFGATPADRTGKNYTVTNAIADRTFNADLTSVAELADILATVIADLRSFGLLG